jgi:excisionase family DNA binding protein
MSRRFLTENEVAERTQISLGTLRRWRLENRGPRYHKFGSLVRYAEDDLTVWQEAQPRGGSDPLKIGPGSEGRSRTVQKVAMGR